MRTVKMAVLALVASWAIGCISLDSVIKVKADGSGTMEQTMLINSSSMWMMSMMGGRRGQGCQAPKMDPATMFSKEKLTAEAANLGEGVTFVSSEPAAQGEMKGVKAVYAFTDFNKLRVSTALPDMEEGGTKVIGQGRGAADPLHSQRRLVDADDEPARGVGQGRRKSAPRARKPDDKSEKPEMPKEMMAMLAPMFKDMRVAIAVEPVGTLVRTNATHVQGKRVTLFDVAFGELFADPAGLEKMEKLGNNPSLTEIKAALKGMKGIKNQRRRQARNRVQVDGVRAGHLNVRQAAAQVSGTRCRLQACSLRLPPLHERARQILRRATQFRLLLVCVGDADQSRLGPRRADERHAHRQSAHETGRDRDARVARHRGRPGTSAGAVIAVDQVGEPRRPAARREQGVHLLRGEHAVEAFGARQPRRLRLRRQVRLVGQRPLRLRLGKSSWPKYGISSFACASLNAMNRPASSSARAAPSVAR